MKKHGNTWVPDGDEYFGPIFKGCDVFEHQNLQTGLKYVKKWECAIDGGAHVGSWTRELAKHFETVHAFEPQTDNFICLLRNTDGLENVVCHRDALGNRVGSVKLSPGRNTGCWHVDQNGTSGAYIVPLDSIRPLKDLDVGYLKLDVEGHEGQVLAGAENLLRRCRPVVQIEEKELGHSYPGETGREVLERLGYREVDRSGRDVVFVWG